MYAAKIFQQTDLAVLTRFMRDNPFATIAAITDDGIEAAHIPLVWADNGTQYGCLQGHFARANRIWRKIVPETDCLVIFQGAEHYISANYYPSKQRDHKAVPTWNYQAVHCKGRLEAVTESAKMKSILAALTAQSERGQPHPWRLSDAPEEYVNHECRGIICFEIQINHIEGQFKLSQNQSAENRQGVIKGLKSENNPAAMKMAELIE